MNNIYIIFGSPGSGKGTQAEMLKNQFGLRVISIGSLIRQEIKKRTKIGRLSKPFVENGELVPTEIFLSLFWEKLKKNKDDILLDGFPRNLEQFALLNDYSIKNNKNLILLEIRVTMKKIQERIGGRWHCLCGQIFHNVYRPPKVFGKCDVCGGKLFRRDDESREVLHKRLFVYKGKTKKIIKRFNENHPQNYFFVDGDKSIEQVSKELQKIIKKINGHNK